MSKRTIGLIVVLLVITLILLGLALSDTARLAQKTSVTRITSTPTPAAESILSFSPKEITLTRGTTAQQTVNIVLNSGNNDATGVQIELSYLPTAFSSVSIKNGPLFPNPYVIFPPKINPQEGTISYAYAITPAQQAHKGSGTVAILTFTPAAIPVDSNGKRLTSTAITFLPKSIVTARGVEQSVMNGDTLQNYLTVNFAP